MRADLCEALRQELELTRGAIRANDERLREAAGRESTITAATPPEWLADEVEALRSAT